MFSSLVRSGWGPVGSSKLAIDLDEIAIGIAQMGRTHLPRRPILRPRNRLRTALDEIGIGGVHVIHAENEHSRMPLRFPWGCCLPERSSKSLAGHKLYSSAIRFKVGIPHRLITKGHTKPHHIPPESDRRSNIADQQTYIHKFHYILLFVFT